MLHRARSDNVSGPQLLSLGSSLFLSQTYVGHIAGRGRESPRKSISGSSLLPLGPQELISRGFPDLLGWWRQPSLDWKPSDVSSLLQHRASCVTHAPTHFCAALSQLSGKAELCSRHDSKEHLTDSCALKGILFCLPLLHYLFPCVRSSVCRLSWNSNYRLDRTFSSSRLIHQHCSNSKLHPT